MLKISFLHGNKVIHTRIVQHPQSYNTKMIFFYTEQLKYNRNNNETIQLMNNSAGKTVVSAQSISVEWSSRPNTKQHRLKVV